MARGCVVGGLIVSLVLGFGATQVPDRSGIEVRVPAAPMVVPMDGRAWLVFELHLHNRGTTTITVRDVLIADGDGTTVTRLGGAALASGMDQPPGAVDTDVPAGGRRVVYIDAVLANGRTPPATLGYDVLATSAGAQLGATGGRVAVDRRPAAVLAAPLEGGPWAAVHHPEWERGHRRVYYTIDGVTRLPGRFTIDFVRLDASGRTTRGDADVVRDSLGYGAPVLAVADAVVAATRDNLPEPVRVSARRSHAPADAAGNYVALDLGDGRFAVYEHLKPGSLRVRPGQRVRRGDRIAEVGFTGDSTGPHLHLHVGDAATPLVAEGLPFVFERFVVLGRYPDIAAMGRTGWSPAGAGPRVRERPAPNVVIDFGAGR